MSGMSHSAKPAYDKGSVRDALRRELSARGHEMASDTLGSRGELYVIGDNDLAKALFEFKETAVEACDTMYQGSWTQGLPPRFAVLPKQAAEESEFELIEQMRVVPLLWHSADGEVHFDRLDETLAENL